MDFTSAITLKFNDLFSPGFNQAYTSILNLKGSLDGLSGAQLGGMQRTLTGITTALGNINPSGITGIGTEVTAASGSMTGLVQALDGLTQGVHGMAGIPPVGLGTGVPPVTPAPVTPAPVPPAPVVDDLAEMLGMNSTAYLDGMTESLQGIGAGFRAAVPPVSGFKAALSSLKADTINHTKTAMDGMNAAMEQINQNQAMTRLAADLATMANMTAPLRNALADMLNEPSKVAGNFETSLKNIQVVAGGTAEDMALLSNNLLQMGSTALAGPLAVAEAYNDIAGGITDASARMGALQASIALAEAGQADLGIATNGMVKVMNAGGDLKSMMDRGRGNDKEDKR